MIMKTRNAKKYINSVGRRMSGKHAKFVFSQLLKLEFDFWDKYNFVPVFREPRKYVINWTQVESADRESWVDSAEWFVLHRVR